MLQLGVDGHENISSSRMLMIGEAFRVRKFVLDATIV